MAEEYRNPFQEIMSGLPKPESPWDLTREQQDAYADWQYEVGNGDTLLGFADWFAHKQEEEE